MPGWWYTIESTTTKHLLDQFEHACREALSSDRSTRELMRAISAKQRFPVIEWIRKLDALQVTAIKLSERSKKRPITPTKLGFRNSFHKFGTPSRSPHGSIGHEIASTSDVSGSTLPLACPPTPLHGSAASSRQESLVSSSVSEPNHELLDRFDAGAQKPASFPHRTVSDPCRKSLAHDRSSVESDDSHGDVIEPPPQGSNMSRNLSLGSRLGPGHARLKKYTSIATIESLGQIDEEQQYVLSDDEDDDHLSSVRAIRRQMATNQSAHKSGSPDLIETSDIESDFAKSPDSNSPDSDSVYECDPRRASALATGSLSIHENHTKSSESIQNVPNESANIGLEIDTTTVEEQLERQEPAKQQRTYDGGLSRPVTPTLRRAEGSHLSLASVLSGKEEFALSNVEDMFTDADGKYLKQFSSELRKLDAKTSKDELCIEEFIVKSEKEWANVMRNKKLGIESLFGGDLKRHFTHKIPAAQSQTSDESGTEASSRLHGAKPLFVSKRLTGINLFLLRRIGDWPMYSFLIALV